MMNWEASLLSSFSANVRSQRTMASLLFVYMAVFGAQQVVQLNCRIEETIAYTLLRCVV